MGSLYHSNAVALSAQTNIASCAIAVFPVAVDYCDYVLYAYKLYSLYRLPTTVMACMMWPQQTTSLSTNVSQNKINIVAHAITHKRSRDLQVWSISSYIQRTETDKLLRKMARTKQTARLWHLRSAEWLVCLLSRSEFAEKILEIFSFTWANRQSEPSVESKICGFTQQRHYRVDYTHRKKNRSTKDPPLVPQHLPRRNRCGILSTLFTWTRCV